MLRGALIKKDTFKEKTGRHKMKGKKIVIFVCGIAVVVITAVVLYNVFDLGNYYRLCY